MRSSPRAPLYLAVAVVAGAGWWARQWLHAQAIKLAADQVFVSVAEVALWLCIVAGLVAVGLSNLALEWRRQRLEREVQLMRESLKRQAEQDAEQRRLTMLGALAAGLAHELGQPLSAARVGIEGIHYLRQLGREPSAEHVERTLARVGMSILAMTQTIEHLRGLASPQGIDRLQAIDLAASVEALLSERDQWLRYNDARIAWERPAQAVNALGDSAGLRLILTNLLRNAVEAVAGQGEDRRLVRIVVGPGATVAVHDSGPGIKPEHLERLFDPFFTTKSSGARGVGLSLARASALRMGADLRVVSAVGTGSTFTVQLMEPRASGSWSAAKAPETR